MQKKLREVKERLRRMMHAPVPEQWRYLARVVEGYYRYFALPGNRAAAADFRFRLLAIWRQALSRPVRGRVSWERMKRLARRIPHAPHPAPTALCARR